MDRTCRHDLIVSDTNPMGSEMEKPQPLPGTTNLRPLLERRRPSSQRRRVSPHAARRCLSISKSPSSCWTSSHPLKSPISSSFRTLRRARPLSEHVRASDRRVVCLAATDIKTQGKSVDRSPKGSITTPDNDHGTGT